MKSLTFRCRSMLAMIAAIAFSSTFAIAATPPGADSPAVVAHVAVTPTEQPANVTQAYTMSCASATLTAMPGASCPEPVPAASAGLTDTYSTNTGTSAESAGTARHASVTNSGAKGARMHEHLISK